MSRRMTREDILNGSFSTPWGAPMVPPFPMEFRDCRILTLVYRSDPEAIARVLPPPLEPHGEHVMVHVYDMTDVDYLGHYQECNVMVGAALPGGVQGAFSPFLFLNSDIGLAHGREVHGQPKKFAQPSIEMREDLIVGILSRNGINVLTATTPYKQRRGRVEDLSQYMDFALNLNLKAVNNIDGSPAIRQLTARLLADLVVHECWRAPGTVELRPNAQAPLHRLPVLEELEAFYWRADFTLVAGSVVHDYLSQEGG